MEITIEKIVAGGKGMGRHKGKIVFVPDTLPNERVAVTPISMKHDFIEASLDTVIEPSPRRIQPPCPLAGICGGCDFMIADYTYQLNTKKSLLTEMISRAGLSDCPDITIFPSPEPISYRSRFRFRIMPPDIPAFSQRRSNAFVPIADCLCAVPVLRTALKSGDLRSKIAASYARYKSAHPHSKLPIDDSVHVFARESRYIGTQNSDDAVIDPIVTEKDSRTTIHVMLNGKSISFDVRGFFQSNLSALEQLIPQVTGTLSGERALDLYSGAGTFSVFLQDTFKQVVLMEHNTGSLTMAAKNLATNSNGDNEQPVLCASSDALWSEMPEASLQYDTVIADPPRQGLSHKMTSWLCNNPVRDFRYVSCDPVTMIRDITILTNAGYRINEMQLHDFYPQTSHMETLTKLSRI